MDTAMGVSVAATTAFGRKADISAENKNQNVSCPTRELPMRVRQAVAIRRSRPVSSQLTEMMDAPSSSNIVSLAYWAITLDISVMEKTALRTMGSSAVTA